MATTGTSNSNGGIPEGWRLVRLGDVAEVAFSGVDKRTIDGEVPVKLCNYTDVFYNRRIQADMDFMPATATQSELKRWALKHGDVLFTKDSETADEIGIPAFVANDLPNVLCGYHLGLARPSQATVNGSFLARVLASRESAHEFGRIANGITRFGLTLDATRNLPILLPPLPEQRAIAAMLDSIDDAIERTDAVITATEQLRDSLLHQLLTRGVPGWHTAWKDVPGLGTIPADWEVVTGNLMFKLGGGYAPSDFELVDDGTFLFIKVDDLNMRGQSRYLTTARSRWNEGGSRFKPIAPPFIVFPKRGVAIFSNRVAIARESSVVDPNLMTVNTLGDLNMEFLRYLLLQVGLQKLCDNSGIPQINNKHLYPKIFTVPQPKEQEKIAASLSSLEDAIEWTREELNRLQLLKETAAEALLTGRVRV